MNNKYTMTLLWTLITLVTILLFLPVSEYFTADHSGIAMAMHPVAENIYERRPLMHKNVTKNLETATFALG